MIEATRDAHFYSIFTQPDLRGQAFSLAFLPYILVFLPLSLDRQSGATPGL